MSTLPDFELTCLPENYREVGRMPKPKGRSLIYEAENGRHVVIFNYYLLSENRQIRVSYDYGNSAEKVKIQDLSGDFYPDSTPRVIRGKVYQSDFLRDYSRVLYISNTNTLVWFDKTQEIIFVLVSDLEKDVMLHIARDVILEDPTK